MNTEIGLHVKAIVSGLVLTLFLNPLANAAPQNPANSPTDPPAQAASTVPPAEQQQQAQPSDLAPTNSEPRSTDEFPDSPGAIQTKSVQPAASQPLQPRAQSRAPETDEIATQTQSQNPAQDQPREPVGTAAAESIPTSGVAASRPAGAALAPAKQRRVRSILIKVGALVGVGAAIGTTMALSQGSPSKPPGTH